MNKIQEIALKQFYCRQDIMQEACNLGIPGWKSNKHDRNAYFKAYLMTIAKNGSKKELE